MMMQCPDWEIAKAHGGSRDHLDIVQFLVRNSAVLNIKDKWDQTPLNVAQQRGQTEAVELPGKLRS